MVWDDNLKVKGNWRKDCNAKSKKQKAKGKKEAMTFIESERMRLCGRWRKIMLKEKKKNDKSTRNWLISSKNKQRKRKIQRKWTKQLDRDKKEKKEVETNKER